MQTVRVGVVGVGRGTSMVQYCQMAKNASLTALCDIREEVLMAKKEQLNDPEVSYYTDYDEFLKNKNMDAVILANYATEHAPLAIKAMNAGYHVISEVLPCQTMKEAVELIETVERTGKYYIYAENYCFMPATAEMRRRYRRGQIGEFQYGEGEYVHNCEHFWHALTYGDPDHWRNNSYSTFYCTHSLGPIIHITALRPKKVIGLELPLTDLNFRCGTKGSSLGIEMVILENGGIVKSMHGKLNKNNISYTLNGSKGRFETAREAAGEEAGDVKTLYMHWDPHEGVCSENFSETVHPCENDSEEIRSMGHSGSDYYCLWNAMEKIRGNPEAETIDVYEALDMFLPGMFAYRSILAGNIPMDIPDLRKPEERERWRSDTACVSPDVAGDMLLPTNVMGTPDIPEAVYLRHKIAWEKDLKNKRSVNGTVR